MTDGGLEPIALCFFLTRTAKQELAELEKASYPRRFNQPALAKELEKFKGTNVSLETIPDFEARRTMDLLSAALSMAHWNVVGKHIVPDAPLEDFFFPRISVEVGRLAWDSDVPVETRKAFVNSARTLVAELKNNGVEAYLIGSPGDFAENTLRIRVRLKPMPGETVGNLVVAPTPPK